MCISIAILKCLIVGINKGLQDGFFGFEVLPRQVSPTIPEQVEHILYLESCLPNIMSFILWTNERKRSYFPGFFTNDSLSPIYHFIGPVCLSVEMHELYHML